MKRRLPKKAKRVKEEIRTTFFYSLQFKIILSALAIILATILLLLDHHPAGKRDVKGPPRTDSLKVTSVTQLTLSDFYVRDKWLKKRRDGLFITIPDKWRFIEFYQELNRRLQQIDATILSCDEDMRNRKITLTVGKHGQPIEKIVFQRKANLSPVAGYAAIIIDDFGYSYNDVVKKFIYFQTPITLSIIPGLKESQRIRRETVTAEKEFLIHLPMEPLQEKYEDHGYILLTGMSPAEIRIRIQKVCAEFPDAVGINNHQGSKATADEALMRVALSEIKFQNKFFIDSRTNNKSVALDVAQSLGLRSAANELFLDAEDNEDFIKSRIKMLGDQAAQRGHVIAIGHVRKKTLKILTEEIPKLEMKGIEFVPVSKLVK